MPPFFSLRLNSFFIYFYMRSQGASAVCFQPVLFASSFARGHGDVSGGRSAKTETNKGGHGILKKRDNNNRNRRNATLTMIWKWKSKKKKEPVPTPQPEVQHDWGSLIAEFEMRARAKEVRSGDSPPPLDAELKGEIREQAPMLRHVETAAMSALTMIMWNLGRILRLDSFLLMFYPLPMLFVTMRWGIYQGRRVLLGSCFLIFTMMGPLYAGLYLLNTGIMALMLSYALYKRWPWLPTVVSSGVAKGVGLALQFTALSPILRENSWDFVALQVKVLVDKFLGTIWWVLRRQSETPTPSVLYIRYAVAIVLILHSIIHVLFTWLSATMVLDRVGESLPMEQKVRLPGVLEQVKKNAREVNSNQLYR